MASALDSFDLKGKTALVTGASRGIGRAIATGLAEAGADVALLARNTTELERLAGEVEALGRRALVLTCDVNDGDQIRRAARSTFAEFGALDVLVNNAGGIGHAGPFLDLGFDDWTRVLRLNLESTVHACHVFGAHMVERGGGSVINVSSIAGLGGTPMLAHYAVTKAAVISLTRTLAAEWAAAGVRVNALAPGWVRTDLTSTFFADPDASAGLLAAVPSGAFGDPSDVVGSVVYLAGDASRGVTGSCLVADGGTTCYVGGPQLLGFLQHGRIPV
ncbi:glucose 1-dehydrogenase [Saccharothrix sp. S26]|uniref:SDR family NAD(P)-dependent oxidoreductase n=1 Tax=Saccharothrix sp. S26 TaxID=2907215 RepID=UPI001F3B138E|nr:glucose 1-dehydrogenase [Saccharothrix sp. S26]MCE6998364.1 glucose 1-dehydrogenase [Saccharothrix sp. S26]